jgi:NAD(P)-dependent dehydrogenase (short-subunit alcohol dehydrogenase family)
VAGARVLVTGATKGIGRAIAGALVRNGFDVVGTARKPQSCRDLPEGVRFLSLDLLDESSIDACLSSAGPVDILINNAGGSSVWAAAEAPPERLREIFQLDFFGPVRLIQGVLPGMLARKSGTILNIGSLVWRFGLPYQSAYAAAKAALAAYASSLRNEVDGRGVRVVTLDPGDILTTIEPAAVPPADPEFRSGFDAFFRTRNAAMAKARPPAVVADKVLAILRKNRPAPFYVVGKGAGTQALLKRIVPDRVIEKQVRKRYGPASGT